MLTLNKLPKYSCTETIDRSILKPVTPLGRSSCDDLPSRQKKGTWKLRLTASDRLQLDVAVSGDGEMYSWVGENRFEDRSLAGIVGGGVTSTGVFATFLRYKTINVNASL